MYGEVPKFDENGETPKPNERESNGQKDKDCLTSVVHTTLTPASHCSSLHEYTVCLFSTGDVRRLNNILFDEGAQRSFISAYVSIIWKREYIIATTWSYHSEIRQVNSF